MHFTLLVDANYPNSYPFVLHSVKSGKKKPTRKKEKQKQNKLRHKLYDAFFKKIWLLAS